MFAAGRLGLAACHEVLFEEDMRDEYGYDLPVQPQTLNPKAYRGTSFIKNASPVGPYRRPMPRNVW